MKILIELPTWLGDTVMVTPALKNLVNYYDNPEITLIGSSSSIELLQGHTNVIRTYILNKKYSYLYRASQNLKDFDVFFSFRGSFRSKIFSFFISSRKKYKFNKKFFKSTHQVKKYNDFVNASLNTNFSAGKLEINSNLGLTKNNVRPVVGINPGASYGSSKQWMPSEFAKVAIALSSSYDIIIFGGKNEELISKDIENILKKNNVRNYQNLAGQTSISDLVSNISNLSFFITGDSGPMHIAASFQIPTVSIFGPTRDQETSQWKNAKSVVVKKSLDCQPCMKRICPLKHHNCMKLIKSDEVLIAIESLSD